MNDIALFGITFLVLAITFGGLALGLAQNKPLKGSCGGLSNVTGERCDFCGASSADRCDPEAKDASGKH